MEPNVSTISYNIYETYILYTFEILYVIKVINQNNNLFLLFLRVQIKYSCLVD